MRDLTLRRAVLVSVRSLAPLRDDDTRDGSRVGEPALGYSVPTSGASFATTSRRTGAGA